MGKIPPSFRTARFPVISLLKNSSSVHPEQPQSSTPTPSQKPHHFRKNPSKKKPPKTPTTAQTLKPPTITFNSPNLSDAKTLFNSLVTSTTASPPDHKFFNSLLQSFATISTLNDSISLLRHMIKTYPSFSPDRSTYHILLSQACKSPDLSLSSVSQALNLMVTDGFSPDKVTTDIAIRNLCSAGREENAIELIKELSLKHSPPDTYTYNFLIRHLCKTRALSTVNSLIKEMRESFEIKPDLITYTIMIDHVCNSKNLREATRLLGVLAEEGFKPDRYVYNTIMKGYCMLSRGNEVLWVYKKMKEEGVEPDLVTYNTLIFGLSKSGRVKEAAKYLDVMAEMGHFPDAVTYTSLMNGMCREGNALGALALLEEMEAKGCIPNSCTYNTLLHGLCKRKLLERGIELFGVMKAGDMKLETGSYGTFVRELCRNVAEESQRTRTCYLTGPTPGWGCYDFLLLKQSKKFTWKVLQSPDQLYVASTAVPLSADTIQTGLIGLAKLYNCVEELVHSPLTQQALLQHQHRILVEEALEGSAGLLDSCSVARDLLLMMKEHVQDLQSVLRRKGGDLSIGSNISGYICFRKKLIKKDIAKILRALKQMENKMGSSALLDENHHLSMVIGVLREVTAVTICVFRSFLLFLSDSNLRTKPSGWSLISKLMPTRSVASERNPKIFNEVGRVDSALHSLHGCIQSNDAKVDVQMVRRRLETLDASIESLEAVLDCLFRLHPNSTKIETELNKLQRWAISSVSTTVLLTADTIQTGLVGLAELYNCVEELVHSPLTQQALLQHQHRIPVEEALEVSVGLLDSCGVARDLLLMMKEHVQDLRSALHRKGGDLSIGSNISAYICFRKKLIKKDIAKSLKTSEQMENKIGSSTLLASQTKRSGWSLISKLMLPRPVASERGQKILNEVGRVDSTLHSLHGCIQSNDAKVDVQMAQRRLQTLDVMLALKVLRLD
ncbi:hypothetical protein F0562_006808 [Nyssa sinensis]|uniref:Uncharacterized protein n=1 Tax=Nyssa sinensis TaxID=561372 RepID=A0A5J5AN14_9ASTE|nr:hypothetical protein F0562_006808 [Nyssa sinensis]